MIDVLGAAASFITLVAGIIEAIKIAKSLYNAPQELASLQIESATKYYLKST